MAWGPSAWNHPSIVKLSSPKLFTQLTLFDAQSLGGAGFPRSTMSFNPSNASAAALPGVQASAVQGSASLHSASDAQMGLLLQVAKSQRSRVPGRPSSQSTSVAQHPRTGA
jgi:hypothetical protein